MQRLHGSVAKLVNDLLPERRVPFWREAGHHDYFDGCIRDEKQCRLAYHYTLTQAVRHGIVTDCARLSAHACTRSIWSAASTRSLRIVRVSGRKVPYKRYAEAASNWSLKVTSPSIRESTDWSLQRPVASRIQNFT